MSQDAQDNSEHTAGSVFLGDGALARVVAAAGVAAAASAAGATTTVGADTATAGAAAGAGSAFFGEVTGVRDTVGVGLSVDGPVFETSTDEVGVDLSAAGLLGSCEVRFQVFFTSGAAAGASLPAAGVFTTALRGSRGADDARIVPYIVTERGLLALSIGPLVTAAAGPFASAAGLATVCAGEAAMAAD